MRARVCICICMYIFFTYCTLREKLELIIAVYFVSKIQNKMINRKLTNFAASYLKNLLGIRSSESFPNNKQQAVDPDFLIFIKIYILKKNFLNQTIVILKC